jgi:hypothetical protein
VRDRVFDVLKLTRIGEPFTRRLDVRHRHD